MALYKKTAKGNVRLTRTYLKATIQRAFNLNETEYRKFYDINKNKLRAYEAFKSALGEEVEKQSPQEFLYKMARAKLRYGKAYEPTGEVKQILGFQAVSITKGRELAKKKESEYFKRRVKEYKTYIGDRFAGLIENNVGAREIADAIDDPVKLENALADYANALHALIGYATTTGDTFASGEVMGSDTAIDFDINDYLD